MFNQNTTINASLSDISSFINDHLLTQSTGLQLSVIALALLVGFILRFLIVNQISRLIKKETDWTVQLQAQKYAGQIAELKAVLWPLISGTALWIISQYLPNYDLGPYAMTTETIRIAAILLLAWAAIRFISIFIASPRLSRLFEVFAWSTTALAVLGWLAPFIHILDSIGYTSGESNLSLWRIISVVFLLSLFFWIASKITSLVQGQIQATQSLAPSLRVLFSKISSFVLYGLAALLALNTVGIDLTALAVFTGALGVGIGFGLQKIISNFISGIILLLDKSLKPGDVIEVETGNGATYGWVEKLGLRYTSVTTRDGTETLIPNETFITNPVTNWSFSHSKIRRKITVGIAYNSDVEKAMELCTTAANSVDRVIENPEPVCHLRNFGDSSVDLEVRFWISDPSSGVKNVESDVNLAIWKLFQQHNIEIPFPQRDVNVRSVDGVPLEIRAKEIS